MKYSIKYCIFFSLLLCFNVVFADSINNWRKKENEKRFLQLKNKMSKDIMNKISRDIPFGFGLGLLLVDIQSSNEIKLEFQEWKFKDEPKPSMIDYFVAPVKIMNFYGRFIITSIMYDLKQLKSRMDTTKVERNNVDIIPFGDF